MRKKQSEKLVPPVNFSLVAKGIYRGAYPNITNFPFLKHLHIKTILFLSPQDYVPQNRLFLDENHIKLITVGMVGNKEPFTTIPKEQMLKALKEITDIQNHPIYVHCRKGIHQTGAVIGCLRKIMKWSLVSIFEEYRQYAGRKSREIDLQYIELYNPPISELDKSHFPDWLRRLVESYE